MSSPCHCEQSEAIGGDRWGTKGITENINENYYKESLTKRH